MPAVGLVHVKDSESGASAWVNTDCKSVRESYSQWFSNANAAAVRLFNRYKIDNVEVATNEDYVRALMSLFAAR